MLLTKHCSPENRKRMIRGEFRIGPLREYADTAKGIGTYDDIDEGIGETAIAGDLLNYSNPHLGLCGFTAVGNHRSIVTRTEYHVHIFCSSLGGYDGARHVRLLEGVNGYRGNPELAAFVILDSWRLGIAMEHLARVVGGAGQVAGRVDYDERHETFDASEVDRAFSIDRAAERTLRTVFTKPPAYQIEEEYRSVLYGGNLLSAAWSRKAIFAKDLPSSASEMFRRAVWSEGNDCPR